ncbi:hypothetical protein BABINDRAFT_163527 [Babjeviella inositovora NRRL Y-12698]|uniref:Thioredoxin domain-containing protein n=1 Tax=Babjeviella inositovora NRRL Y-12698 TaxID=984486 RepID=A0A1E3QIK3_9ASCO|nr:uncharacterized protein BABINDRAFT_163527 [Babjeviella inositovora NRRL Y-12698]ODQ77525.1 hypothetical protein BABINDRAFT_163527 [Babjeviella inositovora NRRL Y-12698]
MGFTKIWFCLLTFFVLGKVISETSPFSQDLPPSLTLDTFGATIAEGLTFVEFYSPKCAGCRKIAPIWEATYKALQSDGKAYGVSMRQVNCDENGDLCSRENVPLYPLFMLYGPKGNANGFVEIYPADMARETELFLAYFLSHSLGKTPGTESKVEPKVEPRDEPKVEPKVGSEVKPKDSLEGLPDILTKTTFDAITEKGLVFVEFFSPLCGHCVHFAPQWKAMFDRFDLVAIDYGIVLRQVNCLELGDLCEREGVKHFPQFRLYGPDANGKSKMVDQFPLGSKRREEDFWPYLLEHSPNKEAVVKAGKVISVELKDKESKDAKNDKDVAKEPPKVDAKGAAKDSTNPQLVKDSLDAKTKQEPAKENAEDTKKTQPSTNQPAPGLPALLTLDTFDSVTAKGLVFVEFLSPFSSPSRDFAPTWKTIFDRFQPSSEAYGITMRQVNCIDSAALCEREGVTQFPQLSFYGPDTAHPEKGKLVDKLPVEPNRKEDDYWQSLFNHSPNKDAVISSGKALMLAPPKEAPKAAPKDLGFDMTGMPDYLNEKTFDETTAQGLVLIEFFSPYCSHCKDLFPTYKKIFQKFEPQSKAYGIQMRQVNCVESADLCSREKITGYPHFRLYGPDSDTKKGKFIEKYVGGHTEKDFFDYLLKVSPNKAAIEAENAVLLVKVPALLTVSTFYDTISKGPVFVEFYSLYCARCKVLAPFWEKAYQQTVGETLQLGVQMRQVNCVESGDLCSREQVLGFPVFRLYGPLEDGTGAVIETYLGEHTEAGFVKYVRELSKDPKAADPAKKEVKKDLAEAEVVPEVKKEPAKPAEIPAKPAEIPDEKSKPADTPDKKPSVETYNDKKAITDAVRPSDMDSEETGLENVGMPTMLTLKTFGKELSEGLTLVEFFSPYCHHCNALAPIWEATHKKFLTQGRELGIKMRQVNCVEEADLCGPKHLDIRAYPNIQLYGPSKDKRSGVKIETYPRGLKRTAAHLIKYMREAAAEFNADHFNLPGKSTLMTDLDMLNAIAGNIEKPIFVSFWPSTDVQFKKSVTKHSDNFIRCRDCYETRRKWDRLSNAQESVPLYHFNCVSHPKICSALGFGALKSDHGMGHNREAKMVAFLPKKVSGLSKIAYEYYPTVRDMLQFTGKLMVNYQYQETTAAKLEELNIKSNILPAKVKFPIGTSNSRVAFVYHYDKNTVVDEDFQIMGHMLEKVMELPFEIGLYKSSDPGIPALARLQHENMVELLNYNLTSAPYVFDKNMHTSLTLTSLPTLYCFKENTLASFTFQNFDPREIRDVDRLKGWMETNGFPAIHSLKPVNYHYYFNDELAQTNDKVLVTLVNSETQTPDDLNAIIRTLSVAQHEYSYMKAKYLYDDIVNQRLIKDKEVAALKGDAASKRMKQEISHALFEDYNLYFTYLDMAQDGYLVEEKGWDVFGSRFEKAKYEYNMGDVFIVDKNNKRYIDSAVTGDYLTANSYQLRQVFQYLLSGIKTSIEYPTDFAKSAWVPIKLTHSPYSDRLRFMDKVHQQGFFGYFVLCLGVLVAAFLGRRNLNAVYHLYKRSASRDRHYGILGKPASNKRD